MIKRSKKIHKIGKEKRQVQKNIERQNASKDLVKQENEQIPIELDQQEITHVVNNVNLENLKKANAELGYVICDFDQKFRLLFTFIRTNFNKKIVVFLCSPASVKFFASVFEDFGIKCHQFHERQSTNSAESNVKSFLNASSGLLFCSNHLSDKVNFSEVNWTIQFDIYSDINKFSEVFSKAKKTSNSSLLIILSEIETNYLEYFKSENVPVKEYKFPESKLAKISERIERLVEKNYHFNVDAREAYRVYFIQYHKEILTDVFDAKKLNMKKVASNFGLSAVPRVLVKEFPQDGPNILKRYQRKTISDRLKSKMDQ